MKNIIYVEIQFDRLGWNSEENVTKNRGRKGTYQRLNCARTHKANFAYS